MGCSQNPQCKEKPFFTSSQTFFIKDKAMKNHCVGHLLIKTIGVDELSNRRVIIRELGSSLNDDDAIDASVITEGQT